MESTDLQRVNFEEGYVAVIDKPYRWSSTDVVRKVKFELRKAGYRRIKVGHAGTLDPLATGVLLVCIGRATKRVDALQAERKEYIAGVRLGATTPSFDREHTVDRTFPTDHITRPEVERALASLVGERLQTPPLYSAKKIEGTRAYEFARAGEQVEMRQSLVTIYGHRAAGMPSAGADDPRALFEGNLYPLACARDRRSAVERRLSHLAASHAQRYARRRSGMAIG